MVTVGKATLGVRGEALLLNLNFSPMTCKSCSTAPASSWLQGGDMEAEAEGEQDGSDEGGVSEDGACPGAG
jgi:hypothetical protein